MRFGVVLLAAGASRRMGYPKLLLPWGTTSILQHLLEQWRSLGVIDFLVVVAEDDAGISGELAKLPARGWRIERTANPDPSRGMFSSVRAASDWVRRQPGAEVTHWVMCLGDQPQVKPDTWARVLSESRRFPRHICQPARHGRLRHPVVFPESCFRALADAREPTLKAYLESQAPARRSFESEDAGLDLDLDSPDDYARAQQLAGLA